MSPSAVHHPVFARLWSLMSRHEPAEIRRHRDELLAGLSGRVIELGAGAGSNFAHYPATVTEVLAVEPEPYLRERARAAAARAGVRIEVVDGDADHLPASDGSFDAAVACLVLCTVPDQAHALAELRRVLRRRRRAALLRARALGPAGTRSQSARARPGLSGHARSADATRPATPPPPSRQPASRSRISAACGSTRCRSPPGRPHMRSAVPIDADAETPSGSARRTPDAARTPRTRVRVAQAVPDTRTCSSSVALWLRWVRRLRVSRGCDPPARVGAAMERAARSSSRMEGCRWFNPRVAGALPSRPAQCGSWSRSS